MALIVITGTGTPLAVPAGTTVTIEALPNTGSVYLWEMLDKPEGSVAAIVDVTAQITTFVADIEGTYFVRVTVDRFDSAQAVAKVPFSTTEGNLTAPAVGETFEANATLGWARDLQRLFKLVGSGGTGGGLEWQDSVISRTNTPPGSPTDNDRYLVTATAAGLWSGQEDSIAVWSDEDVAWLFTVPTQGMVTTVDDESNEAYLYGGSSWAVMAVGGVLTADDKAMTPAVTLLNDEPTGLTITNTPMKDGYVVVSVNGVSYSVGDGVTTSDCYFTGDATGSPGPYTPRAIADIVATDELIWNGFTAGISLAVTDSVDFGYVVN
jgi:hypothetical protein